MLTLTGTVRAVTILGGGLNKKTGEVDFDELRKVAPEVFATRTIPPADPGAGSRQNGVSKPSMNDFLRAAAGRG